MGVQGVASCIHRNQPEGSRTCQQPIACHKILRCRSSSRLANEWETVRLVVDHVVGYNGGLDQVGTPVDRVLHMSIPLNASKTGAGSPLDGLISCLVFANTSAVPTYRRYSRIAWPADHLIPLPSTPRELRSHQHLGLLHRSLAKIRQLS